jgi:glycosyltransferase involved in cell wall biosynthesis
MKGRMLGLVAAWRTFWSRTSHDRRRLLRSAWTTAREHGVGHALRRARQSAALATDRDAENQRYAEWCRRHTPDAPALARLGAQAAAWPYRPLISILTPVYNTDPRLLEACAASVLAQVYDRWEWQIADDGSTDGATVEALSRLAARDRRISVHRLSHNAGISTATNVALTAARGDYIALLDHDDVLLPHAAARMVEHLNCGGERPDVMYSDEDKLEEDGTRTDAYFKPDWSPDLFLSNMYACHWLLARRSLVQELGGFRSAFDFSQDYDLVLRLMERANRIDHIPDVLYHWRKAPQSTASAGTAKPAAHLAGRRALQDYLDRNAIPGRVEDAGPPGFFRLVFRLARTPPVTILGDWQVDDRERLRAATDYPEVEFASTVERASGELLLFLSSAYAPASRDWLHTLVQLALRPGVGAVGGKLLGADDTVEHIGLVLGVAGVAGRPLAGAPSSYPGYFGNALLMRTVSAVTADCLLTPRAVVERVGPPDASLGSDAAGVDYGLRLAKHGLRVVFTPWCALRRRDPAPLPGISAAEAERLHAAWGAALDRDPFYNVNLSREALDFRVAV